MKVAWETTTDLRYCNINTILRLHFKVYVLDNSPFWRNVLTEPIFEFFYFISFEILNKKGDKETCTIYLRWGKGNKKFVEGMVLSKNSVKLMVTTGQISKTKTFCYS